MAGMDGGISNLNSIRSLYGENQAGGAPVRAAREADAVAKRLDELPGVVFADAASQSLERDSGSGEKRGSVEDSVRQTNASMEMNNHTMRFRINRDYGEVQVQIVDSRRDKVIRSIPSDEMMRLASRMRELSGVGAMVDESR